MTDGSIARDEAQVSAAPSHATRSQGPTPSVMSDSLQRFIAGTVLARPWFDHATLFGLKHMFFPGSRAWAAAAEAGDDYAAFCAAVPIPVRHEKREVITRSLVKIAESRATAEAVEAAWEQAFFGPDTRRGAAELHAIEAARLTARHAYNSTRWGLRLRLPANLPRAKLAIETPASVEAVHGGGLVAFDARSAPPATMPAIETSRSISTSTGTEFWLRFKSPSARLGDTAYARVHEPHDAMNAPTLIFGHGVCVDFDHWKGLIDESQALAARGFRIIRPEAPWHGRRAPVGRFGGERSIGAFPMGMLDSFSGALQEWAVLSDWARKRSKGALVFGGSSLGAMTSQLAADRSHTWPAALRPDALFLVTHTGDMGAAVTDGALANLWASPEVVKSFGWTPELARRYLSLLNPVNTIPMPPENIVSILGRRDVILPFESGRQLVARWGVPERSAFVWDRGHFSVPASLIRNTAPLDRLCQITANYR